MSLFMLLVQPPRHGVDIPSKTLWTHGRDVKGTHRSAMCRRALVPLLLCVCRRPRFFCKVRGSMRASPVGDYARDAMRGGRFIDIDAGRCELSPYFGQTA